MSEEKLYIDDGELVYYINENEFIACDEIPMPMLEGIKHLQQKVEQLEKELNQEKEEYAGLHKVLNNKEEEFEKENYNNVVEISRLKREVEQLENIRKEAIEYIKNNKETREHYEPYGTPMGNSNYITTHIFGYYELLDILNKGDNNGK